MRTIVEPKKHIAALWSKPEIRDGETFRMMRYVMRVDHDGKVLIHNVVTGQLVVLDQEEVDILDRLPLNYRPGMKALVDEHYLVPENYDEHRQVVNLRMILQKLKDARKPDGIITQYTILPTTLCNARCYYCYEQGIKPVTMTEETAKSIVEFINNHCDEKRTVSIMWFGGEPSVGTKLIDQICLGLLEKGIRFFSSITTNGYLFDEELVSNAISLWNLREVCISVDGTETTYNETKAFVAAQGSPYKRVMKNVGLFLDNNITVYMRMNFDIANYNEFTTLVNEVLLRFHCDDHFHLSAHPVNGDFRNKKGELLHGSEDWFCNKLAQLNWLAWENGLFHDYPRLPCMRVNGCTASNKGSLVITPEGNLAKCPEVFCGDNVIGNVWDGIVHKELVKSWTVFSDYKRCELCTYFPYCDRLKNCGAMDRCTSKLDYTLRFQEAIKKCYSLKGWIYKEE